MKQQNSLKEFQHGLKEFSTCISTIVNTVLLSIVYIVGVGIASLSNKLSKKELLELKQKDTTYWSDFKQSDKHYRQF